MRNLQLTGFLIVLLIAPLFLNVGNVNLAVAQTKPDVFVGIDVAFDNITATKELADTIRPYTNLFIIGCSYNITMLNTARLNDLFDLCQYIYNKGFYFMLFENIAPMTDIVNHVRQYGDRFLGFYAYDELGGRQLDQASNNPYFTSAVNCSDAADKFVSRVNSWLFEGNRFGFSHSFASTTEFQLFTSDYAMYYFDYKAGYNVVLAEFAWNWSRQLNLALCRGAAATQSKDWGTMITWKYDRAPFIESSSDLYADMVMSYDNGAKYIAIFDTNNHWNETTLTPQHLDAIKQFWQYTQSNPRTQGSSGRVTYILPEGYAYGFRGPNDKIWGIWPANMTSYMISVSVGVLLQKYESNLDITYEDAFQENNTFGYSSLIYWNDPAAVSDLWPTDWPIQAITPTPTSSPTPPFTNQLGKSDSLSPFFYIAVGAAVASAIFVTGHLLVYKIRHHRSETSSSHRS
jgi:hypothetical protein